jgi:hypothetical protein
MTVRYRRYDRLHQYRDTDVALRQLSIRPEACHSRRGGAEFAPTASTRRTTKLLTRVRNHLTFANVIALIALFVALGGTSYAAIKIGSKQIKNNSIKSVDVKNNSIKSADIRNR